MTTRVFGPGNRNKPGQLPMPVYVYRRRDGSSFELEERITEDALVICPTRGQSVERVMQPFSPRYTGSGFYSTDHKKARSRPDRTDQVAPANPVQGALSPTRRQQRHEELLAKRSSVRLQASNRAGGHHE